MASATGAPRLSYSAAFVMAQARPCHSALLLLPSFTLLHQYSRPFKGYLPKYHKDGEKGEEVLPKPCSDLWILV